MENLLSFDEAMISDCVVRIESMEVFPAIQGDEQIVGGLEDATPVLLERTAREEASSFSPERDAVRHEGDVTLPNPISAVDCVEFLTRFLEQHNHALESPRHNKIQMKKMLRRIAKELRVLPNGNRSIIKNDDEDIMSNWKFYMKKLIKEMRVVLNGGLHACNLGVYVFTKTPYPLILEMVVEDV